MAQLGLEGKDQVTGGNRSLCIYILVAISHWSVNMLCSSCLSVTAHVRILGAGRVAHYDYDGRSQIGIVTPPIYDGGLLTGSLLSLSLH